MKKLLFLTAIGLLSINIQAQTKLEYKLEKGQTFKVQQEATQIITQELQGTSHELTNVITGEFKMTVADIKNGNYIIDMSYTDLQMKMTSNLQGEMMNVKAKEVNTAEPQSLMFNAMLNIPVQITLAKNGKIVVVEGGSKLINKMLSAAGITDEATLNMVKPTLEKEYGSEGLAASFEQMTFVYPTKAVSVNDSWENEYSGKLQTKNKWTLIAQDKENVELSCDASAIMKIEDVSANMDLTGTQNTRVMMDAKTGFVKFMEVKSNAEGNSTMPMLGDTKIPTKIKSTITYKTVE